MDRLSIEQISQLEESELYLLIGEEVFKDEKNFTALTPKQIIEKARVWFVLNKPRFQERICSNSAIIKVYEKSEQGNTVAAIVDLIAGALTGIAPATVAYLLYRQGIKLLCEKHWKEHL